MRRLKITILDLVTKGPTNSLYARVMNQNLASIMPQVVGVWCEQQGHDVRFVCYTGLEDLTSELQGNVDLLFITAFTRSAQLAYAISNQFRQQGIVTVLGGPHARCYPQDAVRYFDYVLGFTDKALIEDVIRDCEPHRPIGVQLTAAQQPRELAGVKERWKFIETTLDKAPTSFKVVPMIGSMGCPYTCGFCIDANIDHMPLGFDQIREDLRFLLTKIDRPCVGWHDPNFGVSFNRYMDTIEDAVPPGSFDFIAESTLSILTEPHLKRMQRNGFKAVLPGIESWYDYAGKSKSGQRTGIEKVRHIADHINLVHQYIPYTQSNFVLGLDCDEGPEPFELTKEFLDRAPGTFPAFSLLSAFGQASPYNLELQREGRVLPFPFHFLDNNKAMNVRPKNYTWPEFYDHVIDLTHYAFSWPRISRRLFTNKGWIPKWLNVVRGVSSEGFGRLKHHTAIRARLDSDIALRRYIEGETQELPEFYRHKVRKKLGRYWDALPAGALTHDHLAYLKEQQRITETPVESPIPSVAAS